MSKKPTQEKLDAITLKEYVEECFKKMDDTMLEQGAEKQTTATTEYAEDARAAERAAVNRQEGEAMTDRLAAEEEANNA